MKTKLIAAIVAATAVLILALLYAALRGDSSSAQTADLPNVTAADRDNVGLTVTDARDDQDQARVASDAARSIAIRDDPLAGVLSVDLVRLKRANENEDKLVWAVSLDPATIPAAPHLGDPPFPTGYRPPAAKPRFAIVFVDAQTGEYVWRWEKDEFVTPGAH